MAKSLYKIAVVEKGYESHWLDYWCGEQSDEAKAAHAAGKLGQTRTIEAANLREAKSQAARANPGMTVIDQGSARIGGR